MTKQFAHFRHIWEAPQTQQQQPQSINMSFLKLPTELRLKIYSYMAIPNEVPFSQYHGLYLSCHQIQAEMDRECGAILSAHLSSIRGQLTWAKFNVPDTFLEMQHIRLAINVANSQPYMCSNPQLNKLLQLRLTTLTIASKLLGIVWCRDRIFNGEVYARHLSCTMPAMDEREAIERVTSAALFNLNGFMFRWAVLPGQPVMAVWDLGNGIQRGGESLLGYGEVKLASRAPDDKVIRALQGLDGETAKPRTLRARLLSLDELLQSPERLVPLAGSVYPVR
jgi:hypothetical protein